MDVLFVLRDARPFIREKRVIEQCRDRAIASGRPLLSAVLLKKNSWERWSTRNVRLLRRHHRQFDS